MKAVLLVIIAAGGLLLIYVGLLKRVPNPGAVAAGIGVLIVAAWLFWLFYFPNK